MKILVCARDLKIKADVYTDSQKLEQVDEMVYLGSKITPDSKSVPAGDITTHTIQKTAFRKKNTNYILQKVIRRFQEEIY